MKYLVILGIAIISLILGILLGSIPVVSSEPFEPQNRLSQDNIVVYKTHATIKSENLRWAIIADTGSMKPTLTANTHVLQVVPQKPNDLAVGDIITYTYNNRHIIHRIIEINHDSYGWYAITKGDNNQSPDPEKVRFNQIDRVVVGILY